MRTSKIVKSMSNTSSQWMRNSNGFYRNGSHRSTVLWYGKYAYSQRNDINTDQLFFASLKTTKKKRKKLNVKISPHPESSAVHLNGRYVQYQWAMSTSCARHWKITHTYWSLLVSTMKPQAPHQPLERLHISWWTRNKNEKCLKHVTSSTLVKCISMIVSVVMPSYPAITFLLCYVTSEH